jgi:hypothetical protein
MAPKLLTTACWCARKLSSRFQALLACAAQAQIPIRDKRITQIIFFSGTSITQIITTKKIIKPKPRSVLRKQFNCLASPDIKSVIRIRSDQNDKAI